jgi:ribosomal protein S17
MAANMKPTRGEVASNKAPRTVVIAAPARYVNEAKRDRAEALM